MQETLPLIRIPPMHDPDAEIAGLTLTVPSWVSSIERARNNADMNAASTSAKSKLKEALLSLQKKVSEMLSEIREVDYCCINKLNNSSVFCFASRTE